MMGAALLTLLGGPGAWAPLNGAQASAARDLGPVQALEAFMRTFAPPPEDLSLLALARREALDWRATQNLFSSRLTDEPAHFLDWRGHSFGPAGNVFTTVRAATYLRGQEALLVLSRQWCVQGQCQERSAFAWLGPGGLRPTTEQALIPLIRDAAFFPGSAVPCLRGVTLGVAYRPARQGTALYVLPVLPASAARACAAAGVNLNTATRPLRLHWQAGAGKFGW
ncbi:hypothetical protein [Deinococcus arcticus]|uniref:Uncharacterized protein n=1 Tax=Deinococcus arcticus TaxID=2136176 RepID=A0A2T3WB41_9DEIO|nr:hypothetical protein [Deinococcus arcticus]PTA69024.1 hypothetical protein C8263_04315 [Deinococcus arcticus]